MADIIPIILSGGSGTRLWPLSRSRYPKQFLKLLDNQNESLLGATLSRLPIEAGFAPPIIMCHNDHRFLVRHELEQAGIEASSIILEPVARDTAPAIATAALQALEICADPVIVVMPSDHAISALAAFRQHILDAAAIAAEGRLVLLGIQPQSPHTGYGYIRRGEPVIRSSVDCLTGSAAARPTVFKVAEFVEKPDLARAETYLASRDYDWNSGIFVLHARTFVEEAERLAPEVLQAARSALVAAKDDLGFMRLDAGAFAKAPRISIDFAVMEKTSAAVVMPIDVGWSDVGSWSALWDIADHDEHGNHVSGDAILEDSSDCYIRSEKGLIAAVGISNLIVIETPDALLISDRNRTQDVSKIVRRLHDAARPELHQHVRNARPWGFFETLSMGNRFQVKKLHVKPGAALSLQMHHHRSEHWIVVQGTARVTVGDMEKLVRENESVYIIATQWHRLSNPGKVPLELIEVQIGSYLGEDDIIRADDVYKRSDLETQ